LVLGTRRNIFLFDFKLLVVCYWLRRDVLCAISHFCVCVCVLQEGWLVDGILYLGNDFDFSNSKIWRREDDWFLFCTSHSSQIRRVESRFVVTIPDVQLWQIEFRILIISNSLSWQLRVVDEV
jgi:hypothetical protein